MGLPIVAGPPPTGRAVARWARDRDLVLDRPQRGGAAARPPRSKRQCGPARHPREPINEPVTVLVPAWDEAPVIDAFLTCLRVQIHGRRARQRGPARRRGRRRLERCHRRGRRPACRARPSTEDRARRSAGTLLRQYARSGWCPGPRHREGWAHRDASDSLAGRALSHPGHAWGWVSTTKAGWSPSRQGAPVPGAEMAPCPRMSEPPAPARRSPGGSTPHPPCGPWAGDARMTGPHRARWRRATTRPATRAPLLPRPRRDLSEPPCLDLLDEFPPTRGGVVALGSPSVDPADQRSAWSDVCVVRVLQYAAAAASPRRAPPTGRDAFSGCPRRR